MAKHYALRGTTAVECAIDFASSLVDYYGEDVTIHYASGPYIIFTCPAILDKVIKVYFTSGGTTWDYGTAYVSGSSIGNPVTFASGGLFSVADLVLGDSFLLYAASMASSTSSQVVLIGKMASGDFLAGGWSAYDVAYGNPYNTTQGVRAKAITWTSSFRNADNKVYKTPLIIADTTGYSIISGVYTVSYPKTANQIVGDGYLITPTHLRANLYTSIGYELQTPIMVEFTSSVWYR